MINHKTLAVISNVLNQIQQKNNGIIPYQILINLIKIHGNNLSALPLYILNERKFEVKPGVIVSFKSKINDNSTILKDISFDSITGVKFSYKDTPYDSMKFTSGINQVIFGENGVEILDADNHSIKMTGEGAFTEHHDL